MKHKIRVAVVGVGYWGANVLRAFHATDGFVLTTVCDTRPEALRAAWARYPQVTAEPSLSAVLRDPTIEAVVVATPPASHVAMAEAALHAGKHVWVEKPLALKYTDGQRLVALAREQRRALFVDETFLYDPLVERLRSSLASGAIGKPHHVTLERTGMGRIRRDSNVWWNSAPHDVSILHYVLNARVRAIAVTGQAFVQPGIEDVVWASLQMEEGISAHIHLHWLFPEKKAPLTIVGEYGMLRYEGRFEQRRLTRYDYRLGSVAPDGDMLANVIPIERHEVVEEMSGDAVEPLTRACLAFRETIRTGVPAPSSGEQSLRTLAVLEAGAQSLAQGGTWIEVPAIAARGKG
ncbi:MAG: Gfo/Idh/MocA family oxidoreductase [Deltaproteobacteria bacterium]|nr:Gfo/Idh/MocA family oxidoreductase [Deltaproteobacteria bacterium]